MRIKIVVLFVVFMLSACGHTGREHEKFVADVRDGKFAEAKEIAQKDDFYTDESSLLVRYLELGGLHYLSGEYYQALQNFDKAHELSKRLYTKSVSKAVAAQMAGDGLIPYAGESYELSLLRFYQSLTHYRLYKQGFYEAYSEEIDGQVKQFEKKELDEKEKRLHYQAARAAILDWNSFLTTLTNETTDKKAFRQDMLAKTYGAEIHDIYGKSGDRQIAKQLYKDAEKLLETVYVDYPSYADNATALVKYAQRKGKDLYAPAKTKENVKIVLKVGLIAPKIAEEIDVPLPWSLFLASGHKKDNLSSCLSTILPGQRISFEIRSMDKPAPVKNYTLKIFTAAGKEVASKPMILTHPLSETAYREYERARAGIIATKTSRLTGKYVAAVATACSLYNPNSGGAQLSAYLSFLAATKLIQASEYADIRYWGLLPHAVLQQSVKLGKGDYRAEIHSGDVKIGEKNLTILNSDAVLVDLDIPNG